jgi:hypothetical protein
MRLLRVYPPAWRARYGEELTTLIEELEPGARMSWRVRFDVVRAGILERVRSLGLGGLSPRERAREGTLLVLYAWTLFVVGGFGVQKASEHWQAVTPAGKQGLPAAAFGVLVVAAGVGSALVLAGVAVLLPRLAALIRGGGWAGIRRPIVRAAVLSLFAAAATVGLMLWAHSLPPGARDGGDPVYGGVFLAWVVLVAACLFAWAAAAAATARHLRLPAPLLRLEARLGAAACATMVVMTIAASVWWGSLARAAPWFFDGRPVGAHASALAWNILAPVGLMLCATSLALLGATRAVKAVAQISAARETQ